MIYIYFRTECPEWPAGLKEQTAVQVYVENVISGVKIPLQEHSNIANWLVL